MIFKETWQQVLNGTKTQTRRPVKPGDKMGYFDRRTDLEALWDVQPYGEARGVLRRYRDGFYWYHWEIGKTYAVQPGRGKKAVGRIRITKIRRERLQEISQADAFAEGVHKSEMIWAVNRFAELWNRIYRKPHRWEDNPEVWVLEIEVVKEERCPKRS